MVANKSLLFLCKNACKRGIPHLPLHALPLPHDIWCKEWQIRVEVESLQRRNEWHWLPRAGLGPQQQFLQWA
ncbi:hypothetical protein F9K94_19180 [Brucella tritici]|uniref:Uncharacterized protein n=1 Tax=Brucella tritici TaxID=94626 RepID=A0A7V7VRL8_9HYPH|nr:hypothetical protein F9K94_19180 [Brucella tritici]